MVEDSSFNIIVMREGPNYFLVNYKSSSVLRQDPKDAWRVTGCAKFTPGAQELKQWCLDQHEKYNSDEKEGRVDTSFGNEAQKELETVSNQGSNTAEPEDPTANTKMIT